MTFLAALRSRVAGYATATGLLIAALFSIWLKGRQDGKAAMAEEQERHRREAVDQKRKLDSEIDNLAPDQLDQRMSRWVRK